MISRFPSTSRPCSRQRTRQPQDKELFDQDRRATAAMSVMSRTLWRDRRAPSRTPALLPSPQSRVLRQTKRLFVGRLVDKSKGSKTKRFAFDKPQLRRRRPVREKPPSPSHDEGLD